MHSRIAMDIERKASKSKSKDRLPKQAVGRASNETHATGGFDSLKTALLQSIQVRDEEILGSLLQNDVCLARLSVGRRNHRKYRYRAAD